jgi:glycosyltransferase involved in cell wall biosynthesis
VRRDLVDLELTAPTALPDDDLRRVTVRLDERPIGVLPSAGAAPALEQALARYGRRLFAELAVADGTDRPEFPHVTVVVCTRDRADELAGCLEALRRLRYPSFDVLVVDNASRDDRTRTTAERAAVGYTREPQPGLDRARNRGLAEARGTIVAFTDDDARPEPGWLEAVARGLASPEVVAVTGLVLPAELETDAQVLFEDVYGGMGKGFDLRLVSGRERPAPLAPEAIGTGCNMAYRRDTLLALGGFDPALDVGTPTGGGGDLDAFLRVLESGGTIAYRPDAVVRHLHRRGDDALRRQIFDNGRAYSAVLFAAFLRERGGGRARVVGRYWRWLAAWHARRIVRRLARREQLPMRFLLAELGGAALGPAVYLRSRHRVGRGASAGERTA